MVSRRYFCTTSLMALLAAPLGVAGASQLEELTEPLPPGEKQSEALRTYLCRESPDRVSSEGQVSYTGIITGAYEPGEGLLSRVFSSGNGIEAFFTQKLEGEQEMLGFYLGQADITVGDQDLDGRPECYAPGNVLPGLRAGESISWLALPERSRAGLLYEQALARIYEEVK